MEKYILEFQIGQSVYLINDQQQKPRFVTGITLKPFYSVVYELTSETVESWHFGFEISNEKDIMTTLN
jgi:hypothetical protein